jgi:hypothetical protein
MIKVFLFMYICSMVPGNECQLIETKINEFNDMYDCTISGYKQSNELISSLSRDFVNQQEAHIKFMCVKQLII